MAIKQISLITGSYDLDFIPGPHSAAQDDRTDFEELGATGKVQRNRPSGVTHGMDGAILPNTLSPPRSALRGRDARATPSVCASCRLWCHFRRPPCAA